MASELYAIFDPDGDPLIGTIRSSEEVAIGEFGLGTPWFWIDRVESGYTCRPVHVIPADQRRREIEAMRRSLEALEVAQEQERCADGPCDWSGDINELRQALADAEGE